MRGIISMTRTRTSDSRSANAMLAAVSPLPEHGDRPIPPTPFARSMSHGSYSFAASDCRKSCPSLSAAAESRSASSVSRATNISNACASPGSDSAFS